MVEVLRPRQSEIPRNTEGELPESKIFDLLSSAGNAENKALQIIVMGEGGEYSRHRLYKEIMRHQDSNGWKVTSTNIFDYCKTFLQYGHVERVAISPDDSVEKYKITQSGLESVPLAGALLKWSYEHPNHSLLKMLARTLPARIKDEYTQEEKTVTVQETRYEVLQVISNSSKVMRVTDVADQIVEDSYYVVRDHLFALAKNGVISYEAIEKGKSYSFFKPQKVVPDDELEPISSYKTLSYRINHLLTQIFTQRPNEYLSVENIAHILVDEDPEYEDTNIKTFTERLSRSGILSHFERQGYVERKKFSHNFHSAITLSDEQRQAIVSFVDLIDKLRNRDREAIEEGKEFAERALNDPELFSELMLKAKEASPHANQTSREDMDSYLISILYEHPNSTNKQILQTLEDDYAKKLTRFRLGHHLRTLATRGRIISEKTKFGNVYRIADPDNQANSFQN